MSNQVNNTPILQFIQQVKSADLGQQREIKLDIKSAKALMYCLSEINAHLVDNYENLLKKVVNNTETSITVKMDGGNFS